MFRMFAIFCAKSFKLSLKQTLLEFEVFKRFLNVYVYWSIYTYVGVMPRRQPKNATTVAAHQTTARLARVGVPLASTFNG